MSVCLNTATHTEWQIYIENIYICFSPGPARNRHFKSTHIGALTGGIENLLGNAAFDSADVISSGEKRAVSL